ncbi:DNA-binding protein SMUBP-2 [Diorhabda sublineata]|uniref:DNA-binding protein SMUBP-2 n=1 Tax=Diorhabda sublineata TaxID=1163346 RepID=UPI0024E0AAEF|nr:DNA-binding protein SMUBP-2 [Diorhabda sublineata]
MESGTNRKKREDKDLLEAVNSKNLDEVLEKVKAIDFRCPFQKCKNKTKDFSIDCKFCKCRFCISHGLPEIHGCGEAVKREERAKMVHPVRQVSQQKSSENAAKLTKKLKQLQLERKSKGPKKK